MHVIVAKPRIDGKSDYYDDRDLISVSLGVRFNPGARAIGKLVGGGRSATGRSAQ